MTQHLTSAQRLVSVEDLEAALNQLKPALTQYPDDPRLLERKQMLEARFRAAGAAREREKEIVQHLESAQRLHSSGDYPGALARLKEGLVLVPEDSRLLRMKRTVEKSIADAEELKRREAERQQEESRSRAEAERFATFLSMTGWSADTLHAAERQLATFLGPMARILVKRAASQTTDLDKLYSLLAKSLDRETDRQAFLSRRGGAGQSSSKTQVPRGSTRTGGLAVPASPELTPAALEHAARLLVPHVGPIAPVLVKKEALRADGLRALYLLLAEHVTGDTERARFLREAGL